MLAFGFSGRVCLQPRTSRCTTEAVEQRAARVLKHTQKAAAFAVMPAACFLTWGIVAPPPGGWQGWAGGCVPSWRCGRPRISITIAIAHRYSGDGSSLDLFGEPTRRQRPEPTPYVGLTSGHLLGSRGKRLGKGCSVSCTAQRWRHMRTARERAREAAEQIDGYREMKYGATPRTEYAAFRATAAFCRHQCERTIEEPCHAQTFWHGEFLGESRGQADSCNYVPPSSITTGQSENYLFGTVCVGNQARQPIDDLP